MYRSSLVVSSPRLQCHSKSLKGFHVGLRDLEPELGENQVVGLHRIQVLRARIIRELNGKEKRKLTGNGAYAGLQRRGQI